MSSFYCFLNYDKKNDFVIDFDNVWKWLGFTRKDNSKRLLEKFFTIDIDYKVVKAAPPKRGAAFEGDIQVKNFGGAGLNKETIMLNINTFKKIRQNVLGIELYANYVQIMGKKHFILTVKYKILMKLVGFEPTRANTDDLKSSPLDRSGIAPILIY